MKKYLNDKNLNFIAHVATSYEGFNLSTAVDLCIDEWYLGNPINENLKYGGVAKQEFKNLLFGKDYNTIGKTNLSEIMINSLNEFFEEYIAPKYIQVQKYVYFFLNELEENDPEDVYKPGLTDWSYDEYKIAHSDQLTDFIRDEQITDWHFGFAVKETAEIDFEVRIDPTETNGIFDKAVDKILTEKETAKASDKTKFATNKTVTKKTTNKKLTTKKKSANKTK